MPTFLPRHARPACFAIVIVLTGAPALAQEPGALFAAPALTNVTVLPALPAIPGSPAMPAVTAGPAIATSPTLAVPLDERRSAERKPPASLTPLHVSFAVLQAFDVHSSMRAIANGAHETNPLFASLDRWPGPAAAIKVGSTAAVVLLTRRMSRRHPKSAVLTMLALNSAYCWIVAHNYAVGNRSM